MPGRPRPTLDEIRQWPATVSLSEAAHALGIGRTTIYELARIGELPVRTIRVGGTRRVVTASIVRLLSDEQAAA